MAPSQLTRVSLLSSPEVLHFDSGSLGLQQWNQWWVFVLICLLHLVFPFALSFLASPVPLSKVQEESCVVEGQQRKLILPVAPGLFHWVLWVRVCIRVKMVWWQVPVRRERIRSGDRPADRAEEVLRCRRRGRGGGGLFPYENVFIGRMTDGRCCQPGSHCLTVTEA